MVKDTSVLVLLPLKEEQREKLEQAAPSRRFVYQRLETVSREDVADAEIIIGNIPAKLLPECKALRWYQLQTAGADQVLSSRMLPPDVCLTNASGAYNQSQAEFMLGVLLALQKRLMAYWANQQNRVWRDEGFETMLCGSTAVVVGMGEIGGTLAAMLAGLGVYIIGITRTGVSSRAVSDELYPAQQLLEQLPRGDIVVSVLPSTPDTVHLFSEREFLTMRRGALFINTGRGSTVDTRALCRALKSGHLGGAAVDVVEEEPLPPEAELWEIPNLLSTPHIAGHDFLPCVLKKTLAIAAENLRRYEKGEILKNRVDPMLGYRRKPEQKPLEDLHQ